MGPAYPELLERPGGDHRGVWSGEKARFLEPSRGEEAAGEAAGRQTQRIAAPGLRALRTPMGFRLELTRRDRRKRWSDVDRDGFEASDGGPSGPNGPSGSGERGLTVQGAN